MQDDLVVPVFIIIAKVVPLEPGLCFDLGGAAAAHEVHLSVAVARHDVRVLAGACAALQVMAKG